MARIPLGNFDQPRVNPQPGQGMAPGGEDAIGVAGQRLGARVEGVASNVIEQQARAEALAKAEAERQADAMARANAAHSQLQYELGTKQAAQQVSQQVIDGQVPFDKAQDALQTAMKAVPAPTAPPDLSPALQVVFGDGLTKLRALAQDAVAGVADKARYAHFQSQFAGSLDTLSKLAGMPGADIAAINAKGKAMVPLAQQAGLNEAQIQATLTAFETNNWTQQAVQRADLGRNSIGALEGVAHDLADKDGAYANKLDASHRNAILLQVTNRIGALRDRAARAGQRADAKGEQAIAQIDRQIASGIPATADMWAAWAQATTGTDSATAFQQRLQDEQNVQKLLRLPPASQVQYINSEEAKLKTQGGNLQEAANLMRLKNAVAQNLKQMETTPLLYNQARNGDAVKPLSLELLDNPDSASAVTQNLQDRAAVIKSMRTQYGAEVPANLLLPQELDTLKGVLAQATPDQQGKLLDTLHQVAGSDAIYADLMQQLYPKDPTMAIAGQAAHRTNTVTLETHLFSANETATRNVGATILKGDAIMKGKGDKAFKLPADTDFRAQFNDAVGDLFAHQNPQSALEAMNAVKAYYLGASSDQGDVSGVMDGARLDNAITAVLGDVIERNGHHVLLPHGMDEDDFLDAAQKAYASAIDNAGYDKATAARLADHWGDVSLTNYAAGQYLVTTGRGALTDAHGNPIIIDVAAPTPKAKP